EAGINRHRLIAGRGEGARAAGQSTAVQGSVSCKCAAVHGGRAEGHNATAQAARQVICEVRQADGQLAGNAIVDAAATASGGGVTDQTYSDECQVPDVIDSAAVSDGCVADESSVKDLGVTAGAVVADRAAFR